MSVSRVVTVACERLASNACAQSVSLSPCVCQRTRMHLHIVAAERYFVQEDRLSHEYATPRLSVSRTNSLV